MNLNGAGEGKGGVRKIRGLPAHHQVINRTLVVGGISTKTHINIRDPSVVEIGDFLSMALWQVPF